MARHLRIFRLAFLLLLGCGRSHAPAPETQALPEESVAIPKPPPPPHTAPFFSEVKVKDYFTTLDSIVAQHDSLQHWQINEHTLVRMNPWIIDSLAAMDYDVAKARGIQLMDQKECIIFRKGDSLRIPTAAEQDSLLALMDSTTLDVNIPEFRLRVLQAGDTLHDFTVRVGKNRTTYLATAGREVLLQTPVGVGEIVRIERYAIWMNPVDGHRYESTLRDDHVRTALPLIPWIEPSINGIRYGTLIHPTTNPVTLGKASSNGCVGMREGDMWRVYYHAPLGTRVVFRYDLQVGDSTFKDVYQRGKGSGGR